MELQFEKKVIPCLRTVARDMLTQELTQEVRLTDDMPDIGKVLASWGQILVRGKQWHNGVAGVNGGIMVWVLYMPEGGGEPRSVESWIPFQCKLDVSGTQRDGTICVLPTLKGVDARSLSARKVMVRAGMGMLCEATVASEAELYSPADMPEDIQLLKNSYPVQIPTEAGEKTFSLEESVSLPAALPEMAELIYYTLHPELIDKKVVSDKVVMRGSCIVKLLYRSVDGQLYNWDFEIPFSQFAQLDREYDPGADADILLAGTDLEMDQAEGKVNAKIGMTGQYTVFDHMTMEIVEDAYSPKRSITIQTIQSALPTVLDEVNQTVSAEQSMELTGNRVVDVTFFPSQMPVYRDGNSISTQLTGMFQVLSYDHLGELQSEVAHWEDLWTLPVWSDVHAEMTVQQSGKAQAVNNGNTVQVRGDMLVNGKILSDNGMRLVTALQAGEPEEPDVNRPSLILRRAGNDSLWEIAKETGSTVDAIMQANSLQQEPDSKQILLIPVS